MAKSFFRLLFYVYLMLSTVVCLWGLFAMFIPELGFGLKEQISPFAWIFLIASAIFSLFNDTYEE